MKRYTLIAAMAILVTVFPAARAEDGNAARNLQRLFEDDWEFYLSENPLFATRFGDRRYNDKLASQSLADIDRRRNATREFVRRLGEIDRDGLNRADRLNFDIYSRLRRYALQEYDFRSYLMPITNRSGFHVSFPQLPRWVPLESVEDYEDYIERLAAFGTLTGQTIELMRAGMKSGIVLPRIVLEGVEGSIEPHIVDDPEESLLFEPFTEYPETVSDADRERLAKRGSAAIEQVVVPAYRTFLQFMVDEYVPASRDDIAASGLPRGREFYEFRVRQYTTLDVTPEQVHETGKKEVARIRDEMMAVIEEVGFEGDFAAFVEFLRTDPQFYVDSPDELLMRVAFALKRMDGQLPRLFGTLPRTPYGIREIPAFIAPKTTTAYYNPPAGDGTQAGFYYVNTYDLKSRPLYEVEALSFHEAVPGHHLQIARQQELEDLPLFRRFEGFTAFVEGWALYSERLGLEVGFYEDPYSNFGRLTYEMWRACRLVVDTGIHYLGWSRRQAIEFMAENTALTLHNITTEVDRYIAWPGQALAYKIGELKIRELRERAERELGDRFQVREFHDIVLGGGSVPLMVLEDNVDRYIESQLASD